MKYQVIFKIINLNKAEMRDLKIDCLNSDNVLEFESEDTPRIPSKNEYIGIANRLFEIASINNYWEVKNKELYNRIEISIEDVEKKKALVESLRKAKEQQEKEIEAADIKKLMEKYKGWNKNIDHGYYKQYEKDYGDIFKGKLDNLGKL